MIDVPLLQAINDFARATPWLHAPMKLVSNYGFVAVLLILLWLATLGVVRRYGAAEAMAAALCAPVAVLAASLLKAVLGGLVDEARPCRAVPTIVAIGKCGKGFSFPSNHAALVGAAAAALLIATRHLVAWLAVVAALVIAFSRLYLGVHYPHDVLAGLLLGGAVSSLVWWAARVHATRGVRWLRGTPAAALVTASPVSGGVAAPVSGADPAAGQLPPPT